MRLGANAVSWADGIVPAIIWVVLFGGAFLTIGFTFFFGAENLRARPGGNLTGINFLTGELTDKRLELLRELVPGAARVAVLVDPANAAITESALRDVEAAARALAPGSRCNGADT